MSSRTPMPSPRTALALRALGAAALLAVAADHLYEYFAAGYRHIPTIGPLFLLNGASAIAVGVLLVAPLQRVSRRHGRRLVALLAGSGIAIAAGSLAGLLVSESTQLFGFMETGYRTAIVLSIGAEAAAIVLLGALLALAGRSVRPARVPAPAPVR